MNQLRRDIEYHRNSILNAGSPTLIVSDKTKKVYTTIGIHYHTGDTISLGMQNVSLANQFISGWNQMYECSIALMKQLLFQQHDYDNVRFYLATDNPTVREHVRQFFALDSNTSNSLPLSVLPFIPVYVTDVEPDSFLRGNCGDRSALLELYLLSGCDGIVVNTLPPSGSSGTNTVSPITPFASLAKKIGFVANTNFYKCSTTKR